MTDIECPQPLGQGIGLHLHVGIDIAVIIVEGIAGRIGKDDVVVAAGQLEFGRHVTLVHLVDPVEQGVDGTKTSLDSTAVILGVLPRRRDGDDVVLAYVAIHLHLVRQHLAGIAANNLVRFLLQPAVGVLLVIDGITVSIAQRVDEHRLALMAEHGMESLGAEIEAPGLARRRRIVTLKSLDIGIFGGQIRRQQIICLQGKGHFSPVGQRQGQRARPGLQSGKIIDGYLGHPKLVGPHFITVGGGGACRDRIPLFGRKAARTHQAGNHQRQRRKFHQLHLFSPFKMHSPELQPASFACWSD